MSVNCLILSDFCTLLRNKYILQSFWFHILYHDYCQCYCQCLTSIYNLQLAPIAKTELINIYCHGNTLWARRYIKSKLRAVKPIFQWAYNNAEISGALGVKLFRLFDLSNCKLVAQYIPSIWYNFNNAKFNLTHINSALHAISFTYHLFKLDYR